MLHRDLVRGTRHNFECGTWNESGGRADRLRWHGGIVRTGYDERWRFDLRKKASRVMALDRCDSAGESGNFRGQDHRPRKNQQTYMGRTLSRGRVCKYVSLSVVAVDLKQTLHTIYFIIYIFYV